METKQYNSLFSFIWNIANDVLVHAFEKGDYKKIILPFMVLRRIDVLLEPTKQQVLDKKAFCDKNGLTEYEPFLTKVTGYPFYNTSAFTMSTLKNEIDPQRLKMNVIEYFNGFSEDVQDIIDKFKLRQQVDNLTEVGRLGSLLEKFTDGNINLSVNPVMEETTDENGNAVIVERLPGLDNHTMGTIFEELLRKFNEENNVTEAGEHFTPRDYVRLLADLAVVPIKDKLANNTYHIYDGACGTGGILTIAQEEIERIAKEQGKQVKTSIFGQELQADTYATCKADLMISGNINKFTYKLDSGEHQYIAFGSTISQDGHAGEKFDFCISNPPFGTPWKEDLKNWGLGDKKEVIDPRFVHSSDASLTTASEPISFIPDIGDCQMLFLANNVSRMKDTPLGTRIVEVHNGSSLFTGNAGGGESNLRRYIIENDLLEAIIAMPEKDFYNTGISTYVWVVTNRKEERRRGYVQLIDVGAPEEYRDVYVRYSLIKEGDILINGLNLNYDFVSQRVACAPADGIITSAYVVCRPRKNVNYNYYTLLFKAMDSMKLFHGMGSGIRLTLSFKELKKQLLPVPPIEEQHAIVSYITERTAKIDSLIEKLNKEIECVKEYKQRLVSDVVTGQIKVS